MASNLTKPFACSRKAAVTAVFLHVFKCGGSSVQEVFQRYSNLHVWHGDRHFHANALPIDWEYGAADREPDVGIYRFAFVRNPFERLASLFHVMRARRPEGITMDHILHIAALPGIQIDRARGIASDHEIWTHTRPFTHLQLDLMDDVFPLETIRHTWKTIQERLGIKDELPKANASGKGDWPKLFTADHTELVRTIYTDDFNFWERLF